MVSTENTATGGQSAGVPLALCARREGICLVETHTCHSVAEESGMATRDSDMLRIRFRASVMKKAPAPTLYARFGSSTSIRLLDKSTTSC